MERDSALVFGIPACDLSGDDFGQFGGINASNTNGRTVDTVATKWAGKLLLADLFMSHKAFALRADALPLNDFFTGIAGAHRVPLSSD
jgi:hypothetical protein